MPFFQDIKNIFGGNKQDNIEQALSNQEAFNQAYIQQLQHEADLKYGPEAQKTKQIAYLIVGVIVIVAIIYIAKKFL